MKIYTITIGITCFNAQDTISRAIKSAIDQDWPNKQILIVDDGSTDNSVSQIEEIISQHDNVNLIQHNENKGYPSALNTIINNAKGEFIAFFDDDDDYPNNRLKEQFRRIQEYYQTIDNATHVFCYTHRRVFTDGVETSFVNAIGSKPIEPNGKMVANYLLYHDKPSGYSWGEFGSGTLIAPTKTLKKYMLDPDFRRSAEWDLAVRASLDGAHFISINEPITIQHKTQTQDKSGTKPLYYSLMLRKKHKNYLKKQNAYLASVCQAYARFYYFRKKIWRSRFFTLIAKILLLFKSS